MVSQRAIDDAANKAKLLSASTTSAGADDTVDSLAPGTVPLSQLVQQLLKNCNRQSMAALRALHDGFGADPQKHGENDKNISISCLRIQIN